MSEVRYDDWMSESDAVIWHIERDPLLRSTITAVLLLDSTPSRDRLDDMVTRMVSSVPRLRQRVTETPGQVTAPRWELDEYFDIANHFQHIRLPGRSPTKRMTLDYAQHLAGRGFDRDRPLWEVTLVEGGRRAPTALVVKLHHVIADGLGMVQILGQIVDLEADPPAPTTHPEPTDDAPPSHTRTQPLIHRVGTDLQSGLRLGRAAFGLAKGLLTHPRTTTHDVGELSESIVNAVKPATTRLSGLLIGSSMSPRLDTVAIPLADLKAAAATVGGTINTGFVSSVLDGLDRYHREMGAESNEIRMHMPVSVRGGTDANQSGNQFAPLRMTLPLGEKAPDERLAETRELLASATEEPALPYISEISGAIGKLGPAATVNIIGSMMRGVDITTSNVPGPPFPIWTAGAQVEEFYAFGPLAGSAINLTLFSYDGVLHVGINTDPVAVTDPERFVACLRAGFEQTLSLKSASL